MHHPHSPKDQPTPRVTPTIGYPSKIGTDVLAVWPSIPGVTERPVIQIDQGRKVHAVVEFRVEDAAALAQAILAAAAASTLKHP
jgi:hypothetical protein